MDITILDQDQDLVVIAKPANMVVNNAKTVTDQTVQDWFWQWQQEQGAEWPSDWQELVPDDFDATYGTPEEIFAQRQGIVHRLDKDTSGVLLLARHPGSLVNLLAQFKKRQVKKTYRCLVHGQMQVQRDRIELPVGRSKSNPTRFQVRENGRRAVTEYEVLKKWSRLSDEVPTEVRRHPTYQQGFSLVECYPETGRTHQIRVHLAHIRHPLVADTVYLGRKRQKIDITWCPRQFLHARQLTCIHPRQGSESTWQAPLAQDLQLVLDEKLTD